MRLRERGEGRGEGCLKEVFFRFVQLIVSLARSDTDNASYKEKWVTGPTPVVAKKLSALIQVGREREGRGRERGRGREGGEGEGRGREGGRRRRRAKLLLCRCSWRNCVVQ